MSRRYDVVVFDGDDTLWHHERIFTDISSRFRELLGRHADGPTLDASLLSTERRNLAHFGYGVKGFGLSLIETAVEVSGGAITGAEVDTMLGWIKEMLEHPVELIDGVEETIAALEGRVRLAIVTKGDLFDQEGKIARSGLGDRFDHIAIVSEKNEATYLRVFEEWDVDPTAVLMAGNSVRSDVAPLLAIGASAVHVPYHVTWEHEVVESITSEFAVLNSITELVPLINRLGP